MIIPDEASILSVKQHVLVIVVVFGLFSLLNVDTRSYTHSVFNSSSADFVERSPIIRRRNDITWMILIGIQQNPFSILIYPGKCFAIC